MRNPTSASRATAMLMLSSLFLAVLGGTAVANEGGSLQLEDDLVLGLDDDDVLLGRIADVALDSSGNIYVLDAQLETIHVFSPSGDHLRQLGRAGEGPGEFYSPSVITVEPDGRVYVAGASTVITVFAADGTPQASLKRLRPTRPRDMCLDDEGNLYIAAIDILKQQVVHEYSISTGEHVRSFGDSYAVGMDMDTRQEQIEAGAQICFSDGKLWYLQLNPQELRCYSKDGVLLQTFAARKSDSLETTTAEADADGITLHLPRSVSNGIVAMQPNLLLTAFSVDIGTEPKTFLDVHSAETGARVATTQYPFLYRVCAIDGAGRIYAVTLRDELPVVVRSTISIGES